MHPTQYAGIVHGFFGFHPESTFAQMTNHGFWNMALFCYITLANAEWRSANWWDGDDEEVIRALMFIFAMLGGYEVLNADVIREITHNTPHHEARCTLHRRLETNISGDVEIISRRLVSLGKATWSMTSSWGQKKTGATLDLRGNEPILNETFTNNLPPAVREMVDIARSGKYCTAPVEEDYIRVEVHNILLDNLRNHATAPESVGSIRELAVRWYTDFILLGKRSAEVAQQNGFFAAFGIPFDETI